MVVTIAQPECTECTMLRKFTEIVIVAVAVWCMELA